MDDDETIDQLRVLASELADVETLINLYLSETDQSRKLDEYFEKKKVIEQKIADLQKRLLH